MHLAHISSAALLQLPDLATDLRTIPAALLPLARDCSEAGSPAPYSEQEETARPLSAKEFSELAAAPGRTTGVSSRAVGRAVTFCSLRAPLPLLPQNRKRCEVLIKVSFQNSSSSQRGWPIQEMGNKAGDVVRKEAGMELSWDGKTRERKPGKEQAGLLQLLKLLLSQPPLLSSSLIRCQVAPSIQGYCIGDHSLLLPCYHPLMLREAAVSKLEGQEQNFLGSPTEKSGNHCFR